MSPIRITFVVLSLLFSANSIAQVWILDEGAPPKYPIEASRSSQSGCVTLQYFVDEQGNSAFVEVLASSHSVFEETAIEAIRNWKFVLEDSELPQTERKVTQLDYLVEDIDTVRIDKSINCAAKLTSETNDINAFRKTRLSTPIYIDNFDQWEQAAKRIFPVLTPLEADNFKQQYLSIYSEQALVSDDQSVAFANAINGLAYEQIMQINVNKIVMDDDTIVPEKLKPIDASKLPFIELNEANKIWNIRDMFIAMSQDLYEEITAKKISAEILIRPDGSAQLLGLCRAVSAEMQKALETQINDWKINARSKSTKATRMIYQIPSPQRSGSYLECDPSWYPNEDRGDVEQYTYK